MAYKEGQLNIFLDPGGGLLEMGAKKRICSTRDHACVIYNNSFNS